MMFFDQTTTTRREKVINMSNSKDKERISIKINELGYFDNDLCTQDIFMQKKFKFYLDSNYCGKNDLGELKAALSGERTNVSLFSENSIIKKWALK